MSPSAPLSKPEFIALIAMNFALVAFSIDAMLPALPDIAREISPGDINRAQLVLTSFVFGMGLGTLFAGPLSDAFGRKPVIAASLGVYILGAFWAARADSMDEMMLARILQGLGVAGPRIVSLAIIRDLFAGRGMAQIMSFAMMVFTLVPAVAPLIGDLIIHISGWRSIFYTFIGFALCVGMWLMLRQPETLLPASRIPFRPGRLWAAIKRSLGIRAFTLSAVVQSMIFGMLFGTLSSIQQLFGTVYDRAETFPLWFALIAVMSGTASLINARLVMRLGMRRMIVLGLSSQLAFVMCVLVLLSLGMLPFVLFLAWMTSLFFMVGFVIGNLNALALDPLGDIAGTAASIMGAVATVLGVLIAVPIGLAFNGTPLPLAVAVAVLCLGALGILIRAFPYAMPAPN